MDGNGDNIWSWLWQLNEGGWSLWNWGGAVVVSWVLWGWSNVGWDNWDDGGGQRAVWAVGDGWSTGRNSVNNGLVESLGLAGWRLWAVLAVAWLLWGGSLGDDWVGGDGDDGGLGWTVLGEISCRSIRRRLIFCDLR